MNKTMLILAAHPDDMEFMAGGTVAKFTSEGWDVHLVVATNGERGSFDMDAKTLAETRNRETRDAAKVLGVRSVTFLGYSDGDLGGVSPIELREKFIRRIRELKPSTVMTWDPKDAGEFHPDHRAVARAAIEALSFSHFPLYDPQHREAGIEPHLVADRYYFAKDRSLGDTVIDITAQIGTKIESLCAHACQMKLTLDEMAMNMKALGATDAMLKKIDRENFRGMITLMIRAMGGDAASGRGFEFGEKFRFERAGGELAKGLFELLK